MMCNSHLEICSPDKQYKPPSLIRFGVFIKISFFLILFNIIMLIHVFNFKFDTYRFHNI